MQSQYRGVSFAHDVPSRPWRARTCVKGQSISLGHYPTAIEAAYAYDAAVRQYFGEHARVNFPPEPPPAPEDARLIALTRGAYTIVDEADHTWLSQWRWTYTGRYARRAIPWPGGPRRQQFIHMHRLIMDAPADMQVDHINGDKLDNRRRNLRICTAHENQINKPKNYRHGQAASHFRGVTWRKARSRWQATITVNGREIYIGRSQSEEEAARMYDRAAHKYFGEFARLNFPDKTGPYADEDDLIRAARIEAAMLHNARDARLVAAEVERLAAHVLSSLPATPAAAVCAKPVALGGGSPWHAKQAWARSEARRRGLAHADEVTP